MAVTSEAPTVPGPFPIFKVAQRYVIYDADTTAYARREHNICGVLTGVLPQAPQQNVFLGLPLVLLPEEARLLVEKGVSYIVDDALEHRRGFLQAGLSADERRAYHAALRKQGVGAARDASRRAGERKKAALSRQAGTENWNDIPEDMLMPARRGKAASEKPAPETQVGAEPQHEMQVPTAAANDQESLFSSESATNLLSRRTSRTSTTNDPEPYPITPATSYPPLHSHPPSNTNAEVPDTPQSYPIYKHLHEQGYFLAPGLRFGCQYMAYPGDPLRFHSHFLVNGMDWDQEFDLLDLVAGGRLGTGVKKGFMLGGLETDSFGNKVQRRRHGDRDHADSGDGDETDDGVRAFCVEWGGM